MPGKKRNVAEPVKAWNLSSIQDLLDLLAKQEITEFEMEQQGVKIRVRRGDSHLAAPGNANGYIISPGPVPVAGVQIPPSISPAGSSPAAHSPASEESAAGSAAESTEGLFIMKSPIVGTFYSSPSPNAPPFVKVGDTVEAGKVICIIEAMKLMNELEAEIAGRVTRIYVENGQPVEYGQSLFAIEPAGKK